MLSTFLRAGSAFAVALMMGSFASAQAPAAPATAASAVRAKSLLGATITLEGGAAAGTVDDIVMNNEGVVEYLVINNGGKLVSVPWEAAKFNWQQPIPTATLTITPQQYQAIPTYTVRTYPNFYSPAYRTEVYKFYGLNPGQARRLERRLERR